MTDQALIYGTHPSERRHALLELAPPAIIASCILFNFLLCFINTKIFYVSPPVIILCEMVLTAAAVAFGLYRIDRLKLFWIVILGLQISLLLVLSVFKGEFLIKPIRDLMIMPIFVILGLSAYYMNFTKTLLKMSLFILVVALWEAFSPSNFLSLFNFREYYIAKGILTDDLNITELDVFASGERPDGRFLFDLPGVHRISSVFLEPVSLGLYAMITGIYFIAAKDAISRPAFYSGLAMSLILIWLSDARMATGVLLTTLILRPVFARLDHRIAILFFPVLLLFAGLAYGAGYLVYEGEGLGARLFYSMQLLSQTNLEIFLGLSQYENMTIADTGLAYILNNQGFLGFLLFWLPPLFFLKHMPPSLRIYIFGISIYLAVSMLLTQAFFTIKTAALLWFCYGYLISRNLEDANGQYVYQDSRQPVPPANP